MLRTRTRVLAALALALVVLTPAIAVAATTEQQLRSAINTYQATLENVSFFGANGSDAISKFSSDYTNLSRATSAAATSFSAAASSATNTTFKNYATQLAGATQDMGSSLAAMNAAVTSQDATAFSASRSQFDAALRTYDSALTSYGAYLKAHPEIGHPLLLVYLGLLVVSFVLSLGALLFWIRAEAPIGDTTAIALKRLRQGMFLASLAPLIGSAVTYFWYRYAITHGGSYFILWGPVAIGFFAFFSRVNHYRQVTMRLRAQQIVNSGFPGGTYPNYPGR